jgi:hypothetical protein
MKRGREMESLRGRLRRRISVDEGVAMPDA